MSTPSAATTATPSRWRALTHHHLFWPVAVLVALLLINVPFTPDFFAIKMTDGHLYGSLVSIVLFGSPLILVAVGMTLVIATGGIDLSVGAVVAITGALTCSYISDQADQNALAGVFLAMGIGLVAAVLCGLWNGFLVARMGIQPIIATLIIMVAGRGVAQLITDGQIITINSEPYKLIGGGYLFQQLASGAGGIRREVVAVHDASVTELAGSCNGDVTCLLRLRSAGEAVDDHGSGLVGSKVPGMRGA